MNPLPELQKEAVKVTVEDGILMVSGERKIEPEINGKSYHRVEREYGTFARSFSLPTGVSGDKVTADFKDGILRVRLPKDAKATSAKVIAVT